MVKAVDVDADGVVTRRGLPDDRRLPDARHHHAARHRRGRRRAGGHRGARRARRDERRAAQGAARPPLVGRDEREIPFTQPGSLTTRVYAIASGKGGVGKSSVTANLAVAMAAHGLSVGVRRRGRLRPLGPAHARRRPSRPTMVEGMIMPPSAHGVTVISMLPFKPGGVTQPVASAARCCTARCSSSSPTSGGATSTCCCSTCRPARATSRSRPRSCCRTPSSSSSRRRSARPPRSPIRAGMLAEQTYAARRRRRREHVPRFPCPHCGEPMELFGSGGGERVARTLTEELGTDVPLLARVPFDVRLREGGDTGAPLVLSDPDSPAGTVLRRGRRRLGRRARGLVGMSLGLTPAAASEPRAPPAQVTSSRSRPVQHGPAVLGAGGRCRRPRLGRRGLGRACGVAERLG